MRPCAPVIQTLDELKAYVTETLCQREQLEPGAFQLSQKILVQSGKPCGMYFCLHGPRAVLFTAIWETRNNTILFYDSAGERFLRTQLMQAPKFATLTA
jgi:hypothetical protein